jgi:hypothetical protein
MPLKDKDAYLIYLANSLAQNSMIIFTRTVNDAARLVYFVSRTFMDLMKSAAGSPLFCVPWDFRQSLYTVN